MKTAANTKKPLKKTTLTPKKTSKKKASLKASLQNMQTAEVMAMTQKDMLMSLLVMSLLVNLFFFVAWVVLQVTTQYDAEIAQILFTR